MPDCFLAMFEGSRTLAEARGPARRLAEGPAQEAAGLAVLAGQPGAAVAATLVLVA